MTNSDDQDASEGSGSSPPPIPPRWPVVDKRSTHYDDGSATPSVRPPEAPRQSWRGRPVGCVVLILLIVVILIALTVYLTLR